jgi:two-component system, cell cycle sensor histidine kinase and response regulator CckA
MRHRLQFSGRGWNITAALAIIGLVVYMGSLIIANYLSQVELQKGLLEQLRQDTEKRAIALTYFFSERRNDLKEAARGRAISSYFENKALGMSMVYGLQASLDAIALGFRQILEEKTLKGDRIYSGIAFVEKSGEVLAETGSKDSGSQSVWEPNVAFDPESRDAQILVDPSRESSPLTVIMPYFFKGNYLGQIRASIASATVYEHLVRQSQESQETFAYVVATEGRLVLPAELPAEIRYSELPDPKRLETDKVQRLAVPTRGGGQEEVLVSYLPLPNTPCAFVRMMTASEVYGRTPPWQLPFAMVLLSLFVLGGVATAWRINTRNLTLRIHLNQEARSRREVEEKNQQLTREIVERKRAETALRESEERYRRFFEEDLSGAFLTTPEGRILACNPAFANIFGFPSVAEALQAELSSIYPNPNDREVFLDLLHVRRTLKHHAGEYRRVDGRIIHTIENIIGSFDGNGNLVEIKGFIIDNTEQKNLEEQLRHSQKMEAMGTLAGGIAHDFNNILTAVLGNAEMGMLRIPEDNKAHHNLREILKAGKRARDLVKQILTFSRQEKQEPRPLQITSIVKEVVKLLRVSLPETISIHKDISTSAEIVLADPIQIHQLLMNLGTNAGHAMQESGGVLEVKLTNVVMETNSAFHDFDLKPGQYVELTVSDTGCGMDRAVMERIFDPFFSTKTFGEGSGMGLAVVHGIVKTLGGAIKVESEPGKGSTFRVYLPKITADIGQETEGTALAFTNAEYPRMLLVDDDETLLKVGKRMLERFGYRVTVKSSGIEAIEFFKRNPAQFDLLITDQRMPKMDGLKLVEAILNVRPDIPTIVYTGYSEELDQEKMKSLGVWEWVRKPVVFSELARVARKVLEQKNNGQWPATSDQPTVASG